MSLQDDATFTVTVDGKTFHFQAQDSEERESWIRALEDTVARHNMMRSRGGGGSKAAAAAARGRARDASLMAGSGPPPSMADFDKKLAETDSYLQASKFKSTWNLDTLPQGVFRAIE